MKLPYEEFDLSGLLSYPLASRPSKVRVADFARPHAARALGDVAYNIVVHALPHHHTDDFHWHVHVVPRVQSIGGFEQGTGVPINIVAPEQATAQLDAAADTRT